ncbi:MAG: cytochrome c3 family protein [Gallionella sp.]
MKISFTTKVAGGLAIMALSSMAMASVVNSKHNLGSTNVTGTAQAYDGGADGISSHTTSTSEICIFCHTPHGGDQTTFAPIWNRATSTATYIRFSSLGRLTFDAKEAPVGSVSLACLSCHDGTQSVDSVINSSGSDTIGMEDPSTVNDGGFAPSGGFRSMSELDQANGAWDGSLPVRGDMIYIGTDLSNDHPISMQYGGGGISSSATNGATVDPDFAQAYNANVVGGGTAAATGNPGGLILVPGGAKSNAAPGNTTAGSGLWANGVPGSGTGVVQHEVLTLALGAQDRWWVDTGTAGYQSTDFPLYTRTDVTGDATAQPTVECGTCHDPHSGNPTFLRLPGGNQGSQVCLTCHAK